MGNDLYSRHGSDIGDDAKKSIFPGLLIDGLLVQYWLLLILQNQILFVIRVGNKVAGLILGQAELLPDLKANDKFSFTFPDVLQVLG